MIATSASNGPALPRSLQAIAWFSIYGGVESAMTMLGQWIHGNLVIDFGGPLFILAGFGLLDRRPGWRSFIIFVSRAATLVLALFGVLAYIEPQSVTFYVDSVRTPANTSPIIAFSVLLFFIFISVWVPSVLSRPDVRVLFGLPPEA